MIYDVIYAHTLGIQLISSSIMWSSLFRRQYEGWVRFPDIIGHRMEIIFASYELLMILNF